MVRSEVFAVVKASQSGVSLVSTLAEIQAKTNPGTNPVWTKKRINLAEGVYASKTKLNAKNEADFERAVCMRQGGRNYMETLKRPSNTWAQEKAELENRIRAEMQEIAAGGDPYGFSKPKRNLDEIDRDIARIDREMAANEALMRQNEADFQRRMQASAIEDEVKDKLGQRMIDSTKWSAMLGQTGGHRHAWLCQLAVPWRPWIAIEAGGCVQFYDI